MTPSGIQIDYLNTTEEIVRQTVTAPIGTTVEGFLTRIVAARLEGLAVRINSKVPLPDQVLQDGDRITVSPAKMTGEAWVPTMRDFRKYLQSLGFIRLPGGNGDHERWRDGAGNLAVVNPDPRDRKQIDIASVRQLAKLHECSFGQLIDAIRKYGR